MICLEYLKFIPDCKFIRVYGGMLEEKDFEIPIKPGKFNSDSGSVPKSLYDVALHRVIRKRGKYANALKAFDLK